MISVVAFPPYMPDQSLNSQVLVRAENVYPAIDGYRPVPAFSAASDALPEGFQGGASVISYGGTAYLFAGTASALYRMTAGIWTPLVTGISAPGRWKLAQFGDYAIAVNGGDTREIDLNAGTDSVLAAAPKANSIAVIGDFVVVGQADGNIAKVQWSAFNDHTAWTPGVDQSGFQPMLSGGEVMGLAGGEYGIVLQRFRLVRMERTGDGTDPFQFNEVTPNVGCASKASIVQAGRMVFFLSDRGFMALEDGAVLKPIGNEKVDRTFQAALARDDYERIHTAIDPQNALVMWGVPGTPGTIWVYNWILDRWSTITLPFAGLFSGYTSSLSLEAVSALYPDMDTMPYSLDDYRFSGGDPRLYLVNPDGELGTFSGAKLDACLALGFTEHAKGRRARISAVRPVSDATSGISLILDARERLGDREHLITATELRDSGIIPIRAAGRYISTRFCVAAGTDWSYAQALEFEFEPGGQA